MITVRRAAILATVGVVTLAAIGISLAWGGGDAAEPAATQTVKAKAKTEKPASVFVAVDGSDDFGCTKKRPCATFAAAYNTAKPGEIVEVAGGTYPGQLIQENLSKPSGPRVVFRPAKNARVTLTEELRIEATYVEFREMAMPLWYASSTAHHLTFRSIDAALFYITGANDVSVIGGDYGPSVNADAQIKACSDCTSPPRNILVDGAYFHDFQRTDETPRRVPPRPQRRRPDYSQQPLPALRDHRSRDLPVRGGGATTQRPDREQLLRPSDMPEASTRSTSPRRKAFHSSTS